VKEPTEANSVDRPPARRDGAADLLVRLRWPLTLVVLAILALAAYRWTLREAGDFVGDAGDAVAAVGDQLASIGEKFRTGTITHTFVSSIPEIEGTGLGNLELATVEVNEIISITDEARILWDRVSLGETVSEIRIPVNYRYHLRLADPWRIEVSGQTCLVRAPRVRASQPPAIDTERMTKHSESGWGRFNAAEQLEELERSLTPTVERYAEDPRHIDLVREQARRTVAEFVRIWLLAEDHWREDRFHSIVVQFEDEPVESFDHLRPTLELGR
jgi:hypothetical protein